MLEAGTKTTYNSNCKSQYHHTVFQSSCTILHPPPPGMDGHAFCSTPLPACVLPVVWISAILRGTQWYLFVVCSLSLWATCKAEYVLWFPFHRQAHCGTCPGA